MDPHDVHMEWTGDVLARLTTIDEDIADQFAEFVSSGRAVRRRAQRAFGLGERQPVAPFPREAQIMRIAWDLHAVREAAVDTALLHADANVAQHVQAAWSAHIRVMDRRPPMLGLAAAALAAAVLGVGPDPAPRLRSLAGRAVPTNDSDALWVLTMMVRALPASEPMITAYLAGKPRRGRRSLPVSDDAGRFLAGGPGVDGTWTSPVSISTVIALASASRCPAGVLDVLADHPDSKVRTAVSRTLVRAALA
jgi:hypothetical protein